jgi:HAMP domain-containing protein
VTERRHLYYVSVGTGKPVQDEAMCAACSCELPGRVGEFETTEASCDAFDERREREDRARSGQMSIEERAVMLTEPFAALEYTYCKQVDRARSTSVIATLTVLSAAACIVCASLWFMWVGGTPSERDRLFPYAIAVTGLVVVLVSATLWYNFTNNRRESLKHELPLAVASVRVLKPTIPELEATLASLKAMRYQIVQGVTINDLRALLETGAPR